MTADEQAAVEALIAEMDGALAHDLERHGCHKVIGSNEVQFWRAALTALLLASRAPAPQTEEKGGADDGLVPEFTVYVVRRGEHLPMTVDSIWISEELAQQRATLLGAVNGWYLGSYSHLKPVASQSGSPDDGATADNPTREQLRQALEFATPRDPLTDGLSS